MTWRAAAVAGLVLILTAMGAAASAQPADERAIFRATLTAAVDHGLSRSGDETLMSGAPDDAALSDRIAAYVNAQRRGQVSPSSVSRDWAYWPAPYDAATELAKARAEDRLSAFLGETPPPDQRYGRLVGERRRLAALVAAGGWPGISVGRPLRGGAVDARIGQLRARLAAEGFLVAPAAQPDVFDTGLEAALGQFQEAHGLTPDGVVGGRTLAALNVTAQARLDQIDLNLERWRWLPRRLSPDRIEVNVADARADVFENGAMALSMRVVVGDKTHRTPLFASSMAAVVFNPPWNVPASIAAKELYPKERARPGYLARNRFSLVDGHLQQAPGAGNALGRLKFDFDSPFGVYLHDTPSKSAFSRDDRFLSHGCIRLQAPDQLAQRLLEGQGWSAAQIEAALGAGQTRRVELTEQTPLYVVYFTAFVDDAGRLNFRDDPYGWDGLLAGALRREASISPGVRHGDRLLAEVGPGYDWPGAMESTCRYDAGK